MQRTSIILYFVARAASAAAGREEKEGFNDIHTYTLKLQNFMIYNEFPTIAHCILLFAVASIYIAAI
jgi:hypothetical protein